MTCSCIAISAVMIITTIWSAQAEPLRIQNPLALDPAINSSLKPNERLKVNAAFQRYQNAAANGQANAFMQAVSTEQHMTAATSNAHTVQDPVSRQQVNVDAVVAESIALQKAWYAKSGRNLGPNEAVDLNVLSDSPPASGTFSEQGTLPPSNTRETACAAPSDPSDLQSAWDRITTFRKHPNDTDICNLPFGGLIQQLDVNHASTIHPIGAGFSRSFGDPKTAQGVFSFTPTFDTTGASGDTLDASLELKFLVSFLNGRIPSLTVLDGTARMFVPKTGAVKSVVDISGAAFPDNSKFTAFEAANGSFSYSGTPSKEYTFFSYSHSYSVPYLLGTTNVEINTSIVGGTKLTYDVNGGADGFFALAKPNVKASARASVVASVLKVTGVAWNGDITVQNNNSSFAGIATVIPYKKQYYSVERIRAVYAPSQYQATITVTGWFPIGWRHWTVKVFDTGAQPVSLGSFSDDSGWSIQRI